MMIRIPIPYSYKKTICKKRIAKRSVRAHKEHVDRIIEKGSVEIDGTVFKSVADLTIHFYNTPPF